jgi:hypothetical protein
VVVPFTLAKDGVIKYVDRGPLRLPGGPVGGDLMWRSVLVLPTQSLWVGASVGAPAILLG